MIVPSLSQPKVSTVEICKFHHWTGTIAKPHKTEENERIGIRNWPPESRRKAENKSLRASLKIILQIDWSSRTRLSRIVWNSNEVTKSSTTRSISPSDKTIIPIDFDGECRSKNILFTSSQSSSMIHVALCRYWDADDGWIANWLAMRLNFAARETCRLVAKCEFIGEATHRVRFWGWRSKVIHSVAASIITFLTVLRNTFGAVPSPSYIVPRASLRDRSHAFICFRLKRVQVAVRDDREKVQIRRGSETERRTRKITTRQRSNKSRWGMAWARIVEFEFHYNKTRGRSSAVMLTQRVGLQLKSTTVNDYKHSISAR